MLKLMSYGVDINIELDKGIYLFSSYSATGKSYLLFLLKAIKSNQRLLTYDSDDYDNGIDLGKLLESTDYDLVIIDRYDLYLDKFIKEIKEAGKHSIVLIDSKQGLLIDYDTCDILLERDSITVKW